VYRVLVPARAVGIVIGKGGCNVKGVQSSSGARVQVSWLAALAPRSRAHLHTKQMSMQAVLWRMSMLSCCNAVADTRTQQHTPACTTAEMY
jgi:hypothetical protein